MADRRAKIPNRAAHLDETPVLLCQATSGKFDGIYPQQNEPLGQADIQADNQ